MINCLKSTALFYWEPSELDFMLFILIDNRKNIAENYIIPKCCNLPSTMACFEMYVKRKHFLAAFWKAVVVASSPSDKITDFGLECFFFQLKNTTSVSKERRHTNSS